MADQSDVESAFVAAIARAIYPKGSDAPSIIGESAATCRIYRGWPVATALNADLANGIVNVSVFPAGPPRNTTRYPTRWNVTTATAPTLSVILRQNIVTFTGLPAAGQMAGIAVDGTTFIYPVQSGDTAALIVAVLAAQIRAAGYFVQNANAILVVPNAASLLARVEQAQSAFRETRRQAQSFRVSCWCPDPLLRDATARAIDTAIANTSFLTLADGTAARITLEGGTTIDQMESAHLYRRDLLYGAEYPTILTAAQPAMVFGQGSLSSPAGSLAPLLG
ncbi:hypothetical protein ACELLULO517_09210 [Acidisoma cellulosilytica]|uniref:Uncharacterized protein n=1 Tax=Acidisoma cellulosilyticum TaxID=2802395 RepID=A0A964E3H8_9PROT|nr:hypothetical protein [Acidisoma cellulosilyticum]MCB8880409.1 hypothetical protein [Acidisoma cellulosilyticum]